MNRILAFFHWLSGAEELASQVRQLRAATDELHEQLRHSNASVLAVSESHHKWAAESARQIVKIREELSTVLERVKKAESSSRPPQP